MKIIVEIDGREALPVRAIPLATNWETLSPDELAGALADSDEHAVSFRGLVAYRCEDGRVIPIKPIYWENFTCRRLDALHEKLKAQEEAGAITPEEGYQHWRQESLPLLPPGAFVWRDEFERRYIARYGSDGQSWLADPYDGDGIEEEPPRAWVSEAKVDARAALDFDPFIHSAELRRLVMEGFTVGPPRVEDQPVPQSLQPAQVQEVRAVSRFAVQDAAVLQALINAGFDPKSLPKPLPGKKGPKAMVAASLGNTGMWAAATVFKKTWDRLRASGEIADK